MTAPRTPGPAYETSKGGNRGREGADRAAKLEFLAANNRRRYDPWYTETVTALYGHGSPAQFKSMPAKELEFGIKDIDFEATKKALERIKGAFGKDRNPNNLD
jgi:hypothetical protein